MHLSKFRISRQLVSLPVAALLHLGLMVSWSFGQSMEDCAGIYEGTYAGDFSGLTEGAVDLAGSITITFVTELGETLLQGVGQVSPHGQVSGAAEGDPAKGGQSGRGSAGVPRDGGRW